jgi:hypothetical protein
MTTLEACVTQIQRVVRGLICFVLVFCIAEAAWAADDADSGITLQVSSSHSTYKEGEDLLLTITLSNDGSEPVYVPGELLYGVSPWGGFEVTMVNRDDPRDPVLPVLFADPVPGINYDQSLKDEVRKTWILLRPGYSYSKRMKLPIDVTDRALKPAQYEIGAVLKSPHFSEAQLLFLESSMSHRVFNGAIGAKPIEVTVVKSTKSAHVKSKAQTQRTQTKK